MKRTTIDLYRIGTQAAVDLSAVRPGIDVIIFQYRGTTWVRGTPDGGASTTDSPWRLRSGTTRWWHLPSGALYDYRLIIRNDRGRHWLWEPAVDMRLADYRAMLTSVNQQFV
jgi:hypothetical protein